MFAHGNPPTLPSIQAPLCRRSSSISDRWGSLLHHPGMELRLNNLPNEFGYVMYQFFSQVLMGYWKLAARKPWCSGTSVRSIFWFCGSKI